MTVRLRCASWEQLEAIYHRDLVRGALFLRARDRPALGTHITVRLALPSGTLILLSGSVSEHVEAGERGGRGPGIDVELDPIPPSTLWLVEAALRAHRRATFEPSPVAKQSARPPESGKGAATPDAEETAGVAEAEEELVRALGEELDGLRHLGARQVLGIDAGAGEDQIRRAFGELSKRYHPDKYARYHSRRARDLASEIFIRIRDAYRSLSAQASPEGGAARPEAGAATGARTREPASQRAPPPPPRQPSAESRAGARAGGDLAGAKARAAADDPAERGPLHPGTAAAPGARVFDPATGDPATGDPATGGAGSGERHARARSLLDGGRYDEALTLYALAARRDPSDREAALGVELAEGLKALDARDRLEAAQRFEAALELDPDNHRAAQGLTEIRRLATEERKEFLSRLLGDKEE